MEERMINGRRNYVYDVSDGMEIETVALGMLEQNEIRGLLSFRMIQQDAQRYFRYDAEWGIPLAEWFEKVRTKKEVLELTESILEAAGEAEHYLLETDHLCTQIPYLRTDGASCRMAYIPLADYHAGNLTELVRQIWEQINYALDEDYTYIFNLLNAFGRNDIRDIAELRRWIRMLQSGETPAEMMRSEDVRSENALAWQGQRMAEPDNMMMQSGRQAAQQSSPVGGMLPQLSENEKADSKKKKKADKKAEKKAEKEKKADSKHHLFGSGKKQDKGIDILPEMLPEQKQYEQPARKKYYNEIADNEVTVLMTAEEKGYLTRTNSGQEYALENGVYVLGSGGQADISIGSNAAVSRRHAEIGKDANGAYYIKDLNSTNGTFVGGERIAAGRAYPLGGGTRIKLANEEFYFELRRR